MRRSLLLRPLVACGLVLAFVPSAQAAARHRAAAHSSSACANANLSAAGGSLSLLRIAVVCLVNQQRTQHHLPPLRASGQLDRSAQGWTNTMVRLGQFTHGVDFTARIDAVGYVWANAGENIATGYATPHQAVVAWMASAGHCQNILSPSYADVGTGVNPTPLGPYGPATWTQDFGLLMARNPPSHNRAPARGCPYDVS